MNLDKTSNLGQKFAALNILLYRQLLPAIAGFIQVQLFLPSLFIDKVKSDHLYVVWQTNDSNNTRLWVTFFHTHASLLIVFVCPIVLFQSCCSHSRVFGKTLLHEFIISYSHTEWYFLISLFGAREYKHAQRTLLLSLLLKWPLTTHLKEKSSDRRIGFTSLLLLHWWNNKVSL